MSRLYILKDHCEAVVYRGESKDRALSSRDAGRSDSYTLYEFEVMSKLVRIREGLWINDALCKEGEFRHTEESPRWVQIVGEEAVSELLKLLQTESKKVSASE